MRLLLVEDDRVLREVLERGLTEGGYAVDAVGDAETAQTYLKTYEYAVAVIDWQLPAMPGIELISWIRQSGIATPILMLTARDTPSDRIKGLDEGADDYVIKPFDFGELLARLRALQRRPESSGEPTLKIGSLCLDPAIYEVRVGGEKVDLTPREYAIVEVLMRKYPAVASRSAIAVQAWSDEAEAVGSNTIDVHIARLRGKLARADAKLETVRGVGYRLALH